MMLRNLKIIFIPCKENNFLPHFLKPKFLNYYLIFLLFLKTLTLPLLFFATKTPFFAEISKTILLELINQERIKRNLPPLKENPILERSAMLKGKDILEKDYFSHVSPEGISPWYWFKIAGYNFQVAGENLAIGFLDSREVFEAWMNSPPHRQNLLNPNYREIGISILKGEFKGNQVYLVVQHLGKRKEKFTLLAQEKQIIQPKKEKEEGTSVVQLEKREVLKATTETPTKEEIVSPTKNEEKTTKENFSFKFVKFAVKDYTYYLNIFIYTSLIFIIFSISLAIFYDIFVWRKFVLDYKYLVLRWFNFIALLLFFLYLNQVKLLKFVPHPFRIYG